MQEYDIQSAEDIQDALKDLLGGTIEEMMETEMDEHLGYEKSERSNTEDIYGFEASEGFISDVTDKIMPQIEDWQNRPPAEVYPVLYMSV